MNRIAAAQELVKLAREMVATDPTRDVAWNVGVWDAGKRIDLLVVKAATAAEAKSKAIARAIENGKQYRKNQFDAPKKRW